MVNGRQACPGRRSRGQTENTVVNPGLDRQSPRQGARSDTATSGLFIVRWRSKVFSAKRSETPSVWPPPSSAARSTRAVTSIERLPQHLHASVKKALRQAWDQDDANKAERLVAQPEVRRLEHEEPGVSGSILEGLEDDPHRHPPRPVAARTPALASACTNIVENALGTVRTESPATVKRWRHAEMCAQHGLAAGLTGGPENLQRRHQGLSRSAAHQLRICSPGTLAERPPGRQCH